MKKEEFLARSPRLSITAFHLFRFLPLINIVALAGLWFFRAWGPLLSIACGLTVIGIDIRFGITYHLYAAVPSLLILLFFIIKFWNYFK